MPADEQAVLVLKEKLNMQYDTMKNLQQEMKAITGILGHLKDFLRMALEVMPALEDYGRGMLVQPSYLVQLALQGRTNQQGKTEDLAQGRTNQQGRTKFFSLKKSRTSQQVFRRKK